MSGQSRGPYPPAVPEWMVNASSARILDLASGGGAFAAMLVGGGHQVFCVDRDPAQATATAVRLGSIRTTTAQAEALPFVDGCFDRVTVAQSLHRFAPGLALPEIARVLRPGGALAVAYNTRDDTVPWVRKLIMLMQQADPDAMRGDYGADSLDAVRDSPYFGEPERRNFRNWVPITRPRLLAMVQRRPTTARLEADVRESLLREVGGLYDTYARSPEPLLLPFQASAWRVRVDRSQLVFRAPADDALQIPVGF